MQRNYHAPDMVIAACGALDHDQLVAEAGKRLDTLPTTQAEKPKAALL